MLITEELVELWMKANEMTCKNDFLKDCLQDGQEIQDISKMLRRAEEIWKLAHMSIKDVLSAEGMSQKAFSQLVGVPKRTVEDWCRGVSNPPLYARLWLHIVLGHFVDE